TPGDAEESVLRFLTVARQHVMKHSSCAMFCQNVRLVANSTTVPCGPSRAGQSAKFNEGTVFQEVLVVRLQLRHDHIEVAYRRQPCPPTQAKLAAVDHQDL